MQAYMYGFFNNKRIVLYDTLIQQVGSVPQLLISLLCYLCQLLFFVFLCFLCAFFKFFHGLGGFLLLNTLV